MRILVCGGRDFKNFSLLDETLYNFTVGVWDDLTIIHGGARGADSLAGLWAEGNNIPVQVFLADWELHCKSAGFIRNQRMLKEGKPDFVVAFEGGKGTAHMVAIARKAGIRVFEV